MKRSDPRVGQMFLHLREVLNILQDMMLHPHSLPPVQKQPPLSKPVPPPPPRTDPEKLAYTVKQVRGITGVSHTRLYAAMKTKELRAVKYGG